MSDTSVQCTTIIRDALTVFASPLSEENWSLGIVGINILGDGTSTIYASESVVEVLIDKLTDALATYRAAKVAQTVEVA